MTVQQNTAIDILMQLEQVILQLNNDEYQRSIHLLSGNSIGKHVRHILEFYQELINGYEINRIDYDKRERALNIESDVHETVKLIRDISGMLSILKDKPLLLITGYEDESQENNTSFLREITYNIEHSIHHMAILRIAFQAEEMKVILSPEFGVAHSTIKYQQSKCAQ